MDLNAIQNNSVEFIVFKWISLEFIGVYLNMRKFTMTMIVVDFGFHMRVPSGFLMFSSVVFLSWNSY